MVVFHFITDNSVGDVFGGEKKQLRFRNDKQQHFHKTGNKTLGC